MVNYHDEVVALLSQNHCQRLDGLGEGIHRWYSDRTGVMFNVDPVIPSLIAANEILGRAGIGNLIKPKTRR